MAKRSPKVRAAQKRAQRKTQSRNKAKTRRKSGIAPKPLQAARQPHAPLQETHSAPLFGGYELPPLEPLPPEALERLNTTDIETRRAEFEHWASKHSHKHASSYWPGMSDAQVSQAWQVFVFNKEQGYGYDIDVGGEIREYMADWDLDEDISESDEGNY